MTTIRKSDSQLSAEADSKFAIGDRIALHRHFSIDIPPYFCEECGKRWSLVVDGREGRKRRRQRASK